VTPAAVTCSSILITVQGAGFLPESHVTVSSGPDGGDSFLILRRLTTEGDGTFATEIAIGDVVPDCARAENSATGQIMEYSVSADTGHGPRVGEPFSEPSATTTFRFYTGIDAPLQQTWARTDLPVSEQRADRTWVWGETANTLPMVEPYAEAPHQERFVQYYDKARMEVTDPYREIDDPWYVTNGLLVIEMVDGVFQVGDTEFDPSPDPADVPIAGDPDSGSLTYADIDSFGLRDASARGAGSLIAETIAADGTIESDPAFAEYGVTADERVQVPGIDHTVASVFWSFMNADGTVFESNEYVTDALFENPFYATGYPITEAYWSRAMVGGSEADVLWQCFERRCLTYTPGNADGWQVEAGNVGLHYFRWRYGN
jgi:hypothetical protein